VFRCRVGRWLPKISSEEGDGWILWADARRRAGVAQTRTPATGILYHKEECEMIDLVLNLNLLAPNRRGYVIPYARARIMTRRTKRRTASPSMVTYSSAADFPLTLVDGEVLPSHGKSAKNYHSGKSCCAVPFAQNFSFVQRIAVLHLIGPTIADSGGRAQSCGYRLDIRSAHSQPRGSSQGLTPMMPRAGESHLWK